jgi:hypothetical protein
MYEKVSIAMRKVVYKLKLSDAYLQEEGDTE